MPNVRARIAQEAASEEVADARIAVQAVREQLRQANLNADRVIKREIRELLTKGLHPESFADALGVENSVIWAIQRELGREERAREAQAADPQDDDPCPCKRSHTRAEHGYSGA
jgi:hypothetical protein